MSNQNDEAPWTRRDFLRFMGQSALAAGALSPLIACQTSPRPGLGLPFKPLQASAEDRLVLASGFQSEVLISWGDILRENLRFGFDNDYTAFFPRDPSYPHDGVLWVNHESVDPIFLSGWKPGRARHRKDVLVEMSEVGGSLVHIQYKEGRWAVVPQSPLHRRLDARTPIPLVSDRPINGSTTAIGTLANCAGGVTPWGTVLTCEENYDVFYGESVLVNGSRIRKPGSFDLMWSQFFSHPPEHYGWVVEVHPFTGAAKKLCGLGRFSHECATVMTAKDGRAVVYSGDDRAGECLYKFISEKPGSLDKGELFVANTEKGVWISLDITKQPELQKRFKDQTEVLTYARESAHLLGGTALDRPEDIAICPRTNDVYMTLTNDKRKGNLHGSIMKVQEREADPLALEFTVSTFLVGGPKTSFSCPDNLAFDPSGNLWMTNDVSAKGLRDPRYAHSGNNSLYYIPLSGPNAGGAFRVASGPGNSELTGPCFSPDGRTLFLSVQHPGEGTTDARAPRSRWPRGGTDLPRASVVAISGPALDQLISIYK